MPRKWPPKMEYRTEMSELLWVMEHPGEKHPDIDYTSDTLTAERAYDIIHPYKEYIGARYDCSDFRATYLIKLAFDAKKKLDEITPDGSLNTLIRETLTGFKFWIKSPGRDSMCYYSENHLISFAALEYLTGELYPDVIFANDGLTGREHTEIAKKRIEDWLELRLKYGFSEFLSACYYPIDLVSLGYLMRYAKPCAMQTKVRAVIDLLMLDLAHHAFEGSFCGPQGRAYPGNNFRSDDKEPNIDHIIDYIWDLGTYDKKYFCSIESWLFTSTLEARKSDGTPYYEVPSAILEIGRSKEKQIVKSSTGLDLKEMGEKGLIGHEDKQIMFQLGMGALTNPEIVDNTMSFIDEFDLYSNHFLSNMRYLNIGPLRKMGLLPVLTKKLKFFTNGFALERANIYAYRTKDYKLATLQAYKPGSSGAQQTTIEAVLPGGAAVYTNHPMRTDKKDGGSPSYWGGYGIAPYAVQHENVSLITYRLPAMRRFLAPAKAVKFTHAFFPEEKFDRVLVKNNLAFCSIGNAFLALIASSPLEYLPCPLCTLLADLKDPFRRVDLIQRGRRQFWIYEMSTSEEEGSFDAFVGRISENAVAFGKNVLTYVSKGRTYRSDYGKGFWVNGEKMQLEYPRIDSRYVFAERGAEKMEIRCKSNYTINLK
jgi:hypothetical protein